MTYLAFDLGLSHTGVAISYEGKVAVGLTTINTQDFDKLFHQITNLIAQHQPDVIILGAPQSGPITSLAAEVKTQLEAQLKLSPILVNEDYTSRIAQQALISGNVGRKDRQNRQHQAAAAAILQSHLDSL